MISLAAIFAGIPETIEILKVLTYIFGRILLRRRLRMV